VSGAARGEGAGRRLTNQSEIGGALVRHSRQVVLPARRGEGPTGEPVPLLVLRADPDERDALLSIGHPFFAPRAGPGRIGVRLGDDTDWEEIRELVTDSYRRLAPKKLIALLD
jgi:hypothetical protein